MTRSLATNPIIALKNMVKVIPALLLAGFVSSASAAVVTYDDPWEKANRTIFEFNDTLDTYALKPVAKGYDTVTPKPIQNLVSNFFSNLGEIRNTANALLQFKGSEALASIGRFGINSTVGMLGMVDVATPLGIEQKYEDFGLTLAHWGTPSGPYVVLPLLGSRTLRSGIGSVPDSMMNLQGQIQPERDQWTARGVDIVNTRASLLSSEDLIVGDRYTFIRDAYLQRREYLITGQLPEDDF
ncbi:MlaA family lipoprotein [Endozoicomonas arenosclerae]|uniref:MlaA family lipoprotein n=1 Tax=Endozoicomonas arenosclerae TaxID=1633495 RepID=UPI000ABB973D|nr:VacJ family lipoprotein [Endozoicomonas arenosclerae]